MLHDLVVNSLMFLIFGLIKVIKNWFEKQPCKEDLTEVGKSEKTKSNYT